MSSIKFLGGAIVGLGLLFLGACGGSNSATPSANTADKPAETAANTTTPAPTAETHKEGDGHEHKDADGNKKEGDGHDHKEGGGNPHTAGGQVIEAGDYHMEFAGHKADGGVDLDFLLQKGDSHETIPSAKVTAQVQLPDGSEKSLDMKFNAAEGVYTATIPNPVAGEYKVAILSDIDGKKVNGRFSFKQ